MNIQEITRRNYYATRRRGQITDTTNEMDFAKKIQEELNELIESFGKSHIHPFDIKELADIALVCFGKAHHFGYDLLKAMEEKTLFNEQRPD